MSVAPFVMGSRQFTTIASGSPFNVTVTDATPCNQTTFFEDPPTMNISWTNTDTSYGTQVLLYTGSSNNLYLTLPSGSTTTGNMTSSYSLTITAWVAYKKNNMIGALSNSGTNTIVAASTPCGSPPSAAPTLCTINDTSVCTGGGVQNPIQGTVSWDNNGDGTSSTQVWFSTNNGSSYSLQGTYAAGVTVSSTIGGLSSVHAAAYCVHILHNQTSAASNTATYTFFALNSPC